MATAETGWKDNNMTAVGGGPTVGVGMRFLPD
jgi:hypothetical protein